jgi:hypothetical protein
MAPSRGDGLIIHRRIEKRSRNDAAGRPAHLDGLEPLAAGDPAADIEDDLADWRTQRYFDEAGIVNLADETERLGAGSLRGAVGDECFSALEDISPGCWTRSRRY